MILLSGLSGIVDIITVIGVIIVVLVLIGFGVFVYFYKFRKTKNDIKEENKDYSALNRRDTKDYIKIDDIKDNMIIAGNRYIAAVTCLGNDFFDMSAEERLSIKNNYTSFIGSFKEPVVYRQSTKAVDLIGHISQYEKKIEEVRAYCIKYSVDYEDLKIEAGKLKKAGDIDSLEIVLDAMERIETQIKVYNDRLERLEEQLKFIKICANGVYAADSEELYVFSWEYSGGMEGFLHEPTQEEIYQKAQSELNSRANAYISSLANAKVIARRCTTKELELVAYRYFHPISGVMIADSEYGKSSDFVDVIKDGDDDGFLEEFINQASAELARDSLVKYMDEMDAILSSDSDNSLMDSMEESAITEESLVVSDDVSVETEEEVEEGAGVVVPIRAEESIEEETNEEETSVTDDAPATLEAFIKPQNKNTKGSGLFEL